MANDTLGSVQVGELFLSLEIRCIIVLFSLIVIGNMSVFEQGGCEDVGVYEAQRVVLSRSNSAEFADDGMSVFISCPVEDVIDD